MCDYGKVKQYGMLKDERQLDRKLPPTSGGVRQTCVLVVFCTFEKVTGDQITNQKSPQNVLFKKPVRETQPTAWKHPVKSLKTIFMEVKAE